MNGKYQFDIICIDTAEKEHAQRLMEHTSSNPEYILLDTPAEEVSGYMLSLIHIFATPQVCREADLMYERLTADDAFRDLAALRKFCGKHPEAAVHGCGDEYNFYFEGERCTRCV